MYRKIEDFVQDWKSESSATLKIFSNVTEQVKSRKAGENIRSLERLAWHITQTLTEMPARAGIIDFDELEHQEIPGSMDEIMKTYRQRSDMLHKMVSEKWNDAELTENVELYGQPWERRKVL